MTFFVTPGASVHGVMHRLTSSLLHMQMVIVLAASGVMFARVATSSQRRSVTSHSALMPERHCRQRSDALLAKKCRRVATVQHEKGTFGDLRSMPACRRWGASGCSGAVLDWPRPVNELHRRAMDQTHTRACPHESLAAQRDNRQHSVHGPNARRSLNRLRPSVHGPVRAPRDEPIRSMDRRQGWTAARSTSERILAERNSY